MTVTTPDPQGFAGGVPIYSREQVEALVIAARFAEQAQALALARHGIDDSGAYGVAPCTCDVYPATPGPEPEPPALDWDPLCGVHGHLGQLAAVVRDWSPLIEGLAKAAAWSPDPSLWTPAQRVLFRAMAQGAARVKL